MCSSEVVFKHSLDEDLNIESWLGTASNFNDESSAEKFSPNLKKNIKVDKKSIVNQLNERKSSNKSKKVVYRKLPDTQKKIIEASSSGRSSIILKKVSKK